MAVVGCDFRRAPSRWRSRLVLDDAERHDLVTELGRSAGVDGFLDLTTCNRTEWVVSTPEPAWAAELMRAVMLERTSQADERIEPYVFVGADAARHILSVSIGQESFVVGERQIATQLFRAVEDARRRQTTSRVLNGLSSITGRLVRDAVAAGCIGAPAVGVHSLSYHFVASWLLAHGRGRAVAVVGLGAIGRRVRGLFEADPRFAVVAVNRTVAQGEEGRVRSIRELRTVLAGVDAAIVCTSAPHHVIKDSTLEGREASRPMLVLDIGIPEQVAALSPGLGATRAGLDDLTADPVGARDMAEQTRHDDDARMLVQRALDELTIFVREGSVVDILDEVRRRHERFVDVEIPRFLAERAGSLDDSERAHLGFGLKGMVLTYTNDVFQAIKRSLVKEEGDDCTDMS